MFFQEASQYIKSRLRQGLPKELSYHSYDHVMDVYDAAVRIAHSEGVGAADMELLKLAALYHDSGFLQQADGHEGIGCQIASDTLPNFGCKEQDIKTICGMIMATRIPQTPLTHLEEILADADLDYLGRPDFYTIGRLLYQELVIAGIVSNEDEWNKLQINFLEQHHYFTQTAITNRQPLKMKHLATLKTQRD